MEKIKSFFFSVQRFFRQEQDFSPEESTLYLGLMSLLILGVITDIAAFLFFNNRIILFKLIILHFIFLFLFIGLKKRKNTQILQFLSLISCVIGLGSFWFETKGTLGAVCFYFWVVVILGNTLLPVKYHKYALIFTIFALFFLGALELIYPSLLTNPYPSEISEKIFSFIMLVMGTIICGTITSYFKYSYIKNHEEITHKNIELQKTNQELDNLIYSISHDLRAPIVSIMGLVNLHKEIAESEEVKKYIELEERSLDKLDKFIQDLLAYSRVNRMETQFEAVDLQTLLTEIIQQIAFYHYSKQNSAKKQVKIELECHLEKPFFSDKTKMQIILQNLIGNAVHYADLSKDSPFCRIKVQQTDNETIIEISDNGIGIDEKHGNKIFDMFYRGNTNSKGSGLGLYIVKEAMEKMKGKINFHSVLREGTTFKLFLPDISPS